jgi:hypothetical protein
MKRRCIAVVAGLAALLAGAWVGWHFWRPSSPPGAWMPTATIQQREAAVSKEQEWGRCAFTPIEESEAFRAALHGIPLRVLDSIDPQRVDSLRRVLYEQLLARHSGSLERYRSLCMEGRQPVIDQRNRDWVARKYELRFQQPLPDAAAPDELFERFWREEYETESAGRRFREVCTHEGGALIIIGDVRNTEPMTFLTLEEQQRWRSWQGARRLASTEMYLGPRALADIVQSHRKCKLAEVILVIHSFNKDVWCWDSQWYLDPDALTWEPHSSLAVCSRRKYDLPI